MAPATRRAETRVEERILKCVDSNVRLVLLCYWCPGSQISGASVAKSDNDACVVTVVGTCGQDSGLYVWPWEC